MMLDLKNFREKVLKLTQEEFAKLIDVRQDNVSRMEKNPETIDLQVLMKIAQATGTTLDELVGYKKVGPKELEPENTWEDIEFTRKTIVKYIENCILRKNYKKDYVEMIDETKHLVETSIIKPKVAFVGASDVGKSTIINALLGEEKMPTSWTPTTAINVHIKHIKDKPDFIYNDVCIFRAKVDGEDDWNSNRFCEADYHTKWVLKDGDISILQKYAVRQGETMEEVGSAIVFVDSPILELCDLVDLPGFGTGDREIDDKLAEKAKNFADIIIYMSLANAFLRGTDFEFLKSALNYLPISENATNDIKPLSNLYILASQSHVVNKGNKVELENILDEGCKRLYSQVPDEIWKNRKEVSGYEYNYEVLRERFFTYTIDIDGLRSDFENDFTKYIEAYPLILKEKVIESIKDLTLSNNIMLDNDFEHYNNILTERNKYKQLLQDLIENEPIRRNDNIKLREDVLKSVEELNVNSKEMFLSEYTTFMCVDEIVKVIDEKGYKKKKDDMELLAGYISSKLQAGLQHVLKVNSTKLNEVIDKYIKEYEESIRNGSNVISVGGVNIPFNAKRAFAGGLAGLATFGGLAVWASTLGNLGAYILVAKGVSLLTALGISIPGGTAGAAAFVASIGGPIVLGIALAVIIALSAFAILGVGWKSSVAKKIIKEYEKNKVVDKFNEVIENYWNDTKLAFNVAADAMEEKYQEYITDLKEMVKSSNIEQVQEYMKQVEEIKSFFKNIPLQ